MTLQQRCSPTLGYLRYEYAWLGACAVLVTDGSCRG
jgi:hypothetical protein